VDCCDPLAAPWLPGEQPDLVLHAMSVMRNRLSAERKKGRVRADARNVTTVIELAPRAPDAAEILEEAERRERSDRILGAARRRLSDSDRALFELTCEGIDKPTDQARRLGLAIEDIRRARERIKYALRAAIEDDEAP
jgi:hypothetical protein